jgi:hypothetical protein
MKTQGVGKVFHPAAQHTECVDRSKEDAKH